MEGANLKKMYETSHMVLMRVARDLTHEESLFQPPPGGNCANWILGHLVASRDDALRLLRAEPVWSQETTAPYLRGSQPMAGASGAVSFDQILAAFDLSQERLLARLGPATDAELAAPSGVGEATTGWMLNFLHFHEAYHTGQIGLLRRLMGKEGAIK